MPSASSSSATAGSASSSATSSRSTRSPTSRPTSDIALVERWRKLGRPIYYGDASNPLFLQRCGIDEATGVIVTIDTVGVDDVVRAVRARRPDVMIVARAHDAQHARHLYTLEVTDTVPETIEASLQLAESALVGLGVPMGLVIASIHERRETVRRELQAAAGTHEPRSPSRSARPGRRRDATGSQVMRPSHEDVLKVISWNLLRLTGAAVEDVATLVGARSPTCC